MLSRCIVTPDSEETEFGISDLDTFQGSVECVPAPLLGGVDISEVLECHLLRHMSSERGLQKLLQE